jgi:hypothetical protein
MRTNREEDTARAAITAIKADLRATWIERVDLTLKPPGFDISTLAETAFLQDRFRVPDAFRKQYQCLVRVDGTAVRVIFLDTRISVAALTEYLVGLIQEIVDQNLREKWPVCPFHVKHRMRPVDQEGQARWTCPETGEVVAPIGQLTPPADADARTE